MGRLSAKLQLLFGIPQGSVPGRILFQLYTAELLDIIAECRLFLHSYADDMQVYIGTHASDQKSAMDLLASCIVRIRYWIASNRLKLNEDQDAGHMAGYMAAA